MENEIDPLDRVKNSPLNEFIIEETKIIKVEDILEYVT